MSEQKQSVRAYQEEVLKDITKYIIKRILLVGDIEQQDKTFDWSELSKYLNNIGLCTVKFKNWNKDSLRIYVSRIPKDIKERYCPDIEFLNQCAVEKNTIRYLPKMHSHYGWENSIHHNIDIDKMFGVKKQY